MVVFVVFANRVGELFGSSTHDMSNTGNQPANPVKINYAPKKDNDGEEYPHRFYDKTCRGHFPSNLRDDMS